MAPDGQGKVIGNFLICEAEQAFPEAGEIQVFTGEHSSANLRLYEPLHQELVARGLTTAASPRRPSRPIGKSSVHRTLTNPYYKGSVRYQGVTYAGVHEAIVPNEVWDQVQTVLGTHRSAADATQVHEHDLKGTAFCGQCGSRLLVCKAKSSQGTIYPYLVCASRHGGRGDCTRQAMLIEQVERLIELFYTKVQIDPETIEAVSAMIHARFDEMMAEGAAELADLASRRTQLEGEQQKLLQAHYAGAIPLDLLKRERERITASLETIEHRISRTTATTPLREGTSTTH